MNRIALQTAFFQETKLQTQISGGIMGPIISRMQQHRSMRLYAAKIDLSEVLFMVHKVVKGDTLLNIAAKYKTTPQEIMKLNPIVKDKSHIEIGW